MNKLIIILLSCFLPSNILSAQTVSFNVKGSINYPFIKDITSEPANIQLPENTGYYATFTDPSYIETYKESIGGNIGGNVIFKLKNVFFIESGITLNVTNFKRNIDVQTPAFNPLAEWGIYVGELAGDTYNLMVGTLFERDENGNLIIPESDNPVWNSGQSLNNDSRIGETKILYTTIPIRLGYSVLQNKLKIKLGISASILTYSEKFTSIYSAGIISTIKDKSSEGFNNLLLAMDSEIEYVVNKEFGVIFNFAKSFSEIYDSEYLGNNYISNSKYNIFSIGISYHFTNNKERANY